MKDYSFYRQIAAKKTYDGERIFLEGESLILAGFEPGSLYGTEIDAVNNLITLFKTAKNTVKRNLNLTNHVGAFKFNRIEKKNKVSKKEKTYKTGKRTVSVIDKQSKSFKTALEDCDDLKITFLKSDTCSRIIIQGIKRTATIIKEKIEKGIRKLSSISFCSGAGISASCSTKAGFKEVAFCEYNPKEGSTDKFAQIFQENNPNAVMFNIPMQDLDGNDLPYADTWVATLDCTDFSNLASAKKEYHTMHLFVHLMRLFYQRKKEERPKAIVIENVEGFEKVAGNALKLCFTEEGYHVEMKKLSSLDYGSRTKRERFFLVATAFDGFAFPEATGRLDTPISNDGVMTRDTLEWLTREDSDTLKHFIDRNNNITHNHKIISYDVEKDSYIGTIPKSHHKLIPENLIRHPEKQDTYAFIKDVEHLRYLHGIDKDLYLGDSKTTAIQCIGQGVCCNTFYSIMKKLHDFLYDKIFGDIPCSSSSDNEPKIGVDQQMFYFGSDNQLCMNF